MLFFEQVDVLDAVDAFQPIDHAVLVPITDGIWGIVELGEVGLGG